jgi:hypothetical protein
LIMTCITLALSYSALAISAISKWTTIKLAFR